MEVTMKRFVKIATVFIVVLMASFAIVYYRFPGTFINAGFALSRMAAGVDSYNLKVGERTWPYLKGGEGETMLLLHGFGLNKNYMLPPAKELSGSYRLIIPDLPAFGDNRAVAGEEYSIKSQARRLHGFLDKLQLKKIHILGLSMGGSIALQYATEYPDRVKSLIIIGALGIDPGTESVFFNEFKKDNSKDLCINSREDLDRVFYLAYKYPPQMPDHFKDYIVQVASGYHDSHTKIFRKLGSELGFMESRSGMISAPTLIIWGSEDRIFPVSAAFKFKRIIKNSRLVVIEDSGHVTFTDQAEKTFSAVRDFLGSL